MITQEELQKATRLIPGSNQTYYKLNGCPDCGGRGWIALDPFGLPYPNKIVVCPTCKRAKEYWDQHGELPPDIQSK